MTDNYDMDPHEHPETHAEESHGHESKAEAWPDDQPPADGYADPHAEETATSSEETGGSAHEETMEAAPRRSSPIMPIAAGVGGLLLVGAFLYWQFGRSSPASIAAMPAPPPLEMAQPASPTPVVMPVITAVAPSNAIPAPTPMPTPANDVAPKSAMTPSAENPAIAMPTAAPVSQIVAAAPVVVPTTTPAPISAAVEPTAPPTSFPAPSIAPPPSAIAATTAASDSADARLNVLAARIDDVKKELDQVSMGMASPSANTSGMEERLNRMEQQLKQMQHTSSANSSTTNAMASDAGDITAAAPQTKPSHYHAMHKSPHSSHASTKSSRHSAQMATKAGWVLRAATPGEAWIARNEESADLRRVKVGDKLTGIGRVTAIRQIGDNWVVEGSTGTIH